MRTLADRYTLEDCVLDGPHWSYWRGYDGVLRRAVGILAVERDEALESDVLAAARASSAAEDPRLLRVLDVLTDAEGTALVIEWLSSQSLEDLLADGPLTDLEAWRTTLEVAQALAGAEGHGLGHGALAPRWVLRGEDGRVRLLGLGVADVLCAHPEPAAGGEAAASVVERDAQGLGALLYAALTARWPGDPAQSALAPAPQQSGHAVRPRMVRAGVPVALDDVAARALALPGRGEPLRTPAAVAAALELAGERMKGFDLTEENEPVSVLPVLPGAPSRSRRSVPLVLLVCVLALLVVPAYLGLRSIGSPKAVASTPTPTPSLTTGASTEPSGVLVPITAVRDFDPDGDGTEHHDQIGLAIDGKLNTAWTTLEYFKRPDMGGLKPGVGLLVDLGAQHQVGAVSLHLVGHGTSVELRASNNFSARAEDYLPLATAHDAGTFVTLRPVSVATVRYLLIWLTSLPKAGANYQGGIAEISVFSD